MCLIALNWQPLAATRLILAANRDEFYARPAASLRRWSPAQPTGCVTAGQDLQGGGTWLGLGRSGRLAALTNYRDPALQRPQAPTRGDITTTFLSGADSAIDFLEALCTRAAAYNPFNLIVFDGHVLLGFESRHQKIFALPSGVSAVSNADFDTPWPKLTRLKRVFNQTISQFDMTRTGLQPASENALFALLAEPHTAPTHQLPHTGLAIEQERALSAAFITTPSYGTRASTLVSVGHHQASIIERSFDAHGQTGAAREHLTWQGA